MWDGGWAFYLLALFGKLGSTVVDGGRGLHRVAGLGLGETGRFARPRGLDG